VLPVWIGVWSCLPVLAVTVALLATGLPGFPGVVSPIWMIVTFGGLMFSRGIAVVRHPVKAEARFAPQPGD